MNGRTEIHPDAVLETLLAKGGRSNRRANLSKTHDLCRKQYESRSQDFSLSAIGRLLEANDIIKGRALYNAQSADYRVLIQAWAAYAGPPVPKQVRMLASHEYLMRIEDPAIRSIMQSIIAERDKLKSQLNILKARTQVTVDRRPLGATFATAPGMQPLAVLALASKLTPSEHEALLKAISPEHLEKCGLREGSHGEIVNERGRLLFDVGFARAIRKILEG
ncbi:alpha/beta hydrolase [Pseudomonas putida]|uniref:Alpha/beta hydrolase n=1 Tax=Pseudomonas putida TaxID=303 RepID=A0A7Y7ZGB8_PSEPU|nr:gamma-mobile-trio protein GmtX [Pseudomonas putida]NWC83520.1 alpha/beta hydrolase [Pseudomonas putida]